VRSVRAFEARGRQPGSGGVFAGGEGDGQAESLELADVVADLALSVDVGVVVAGSEVVEPGFGVGEQVEDDDQDGAGDSDDGFAFAAAPGQPPVAFAEEGVGPAGGGGDLAEDAVEVGVALAGLAGGGLRPGLALGKICA
jgi:hypothetical protein